MGGNVCVRKKNPTILLTVLIKYHPFPIYRLIIFKGPQLFDIQNSARAEYLFLIKPTNSFQHLHGRSVHCLSVLSIKGKCTRHLRNTTNLHSKLF